MEEPTDLIRSARFRKEREADWLRLEELATKAETQGLRRMSFGEARDLAALYREATTSLAIAREISLDKGLLSYLEALTARAYLSVYAPQESARGVIGRFMRKSGPIAMRKSWFFVLLGFLSMGLGGLAGYLLYFDDPSWFYVLMPGELAGGRSPDATTGYLRSVIYDDDPDASGLGAFATYLFSHNTRIAIFVFGLGVFLCAPAILLTFYNGLIIGVFFALHVDRGLGWDLFGWLSIHGVTELSAICIACGGGIQLGAAVLFPGQSTRAEALRIAGRDAAKLAIVAALMLVAAAFIEGYGRQLIQDRNARLIIGWTIGGLWLMWFVRGGRAQA
ncbi:putative membrane protein SpoIIM required for sporulation [Yoonia maricola]|uniref:Putative membrane protein SpoIIM required for sporulation n=1 Tax=Yoonia maricola TaxID=420999 RepID=A0A2M8W4B8_9RHOB|nr:stage II sporulation protein M [Yoonia maricola]PJI85767.1 putative membrane protein SpoIIM required for sporulation [Yoonia maricola]